MEQKTAYDYFCDSVAATLDQYPTSERGPKAAEIWKNLQPYERKKFILMASVGQQPSVGLPIVQNSKSETQELNNVNKDIPKVSTLGSLQPSPNNASQHSRQANTSDFNNSSQTNSQSNKPYMSFSEFLKRKKEKECNNQKKENSIDDNHDVISEQTVSLESSIKKILPNITENEMTDLLKVIDNYYLNQSSKR